ncbi:hypothetical protein [Shimia thalassica]|uniref:hypothetical protein n=1 Tax=Shimia thalassica TaxID=1715693 RepID=UPI0024953DA4|nr:hypothetical protein [Shimia thalassica]
MSFILHKEARDYFGYRDQRMFHGTPKEQDRSRELLLFDAYYACLLAGTCLSGLGLESDLESANFIDGYPEVFRSSKEFIAGLIVEAELRRLDTEDYSGRDFEREIAKLLDVNSPTRLSAGAGIAKANLYAAGGFGFIAENLQPKPVSAQEFLLRFHDLWEREVSNK